MVRKRSSRSSSPSTADLSIEEALGRAYAHWDAGQADQAEMFCQRVLAAWPGQADALHLLGIMAHAFGNLDLAIQHVRQSCLAPRAPAPYFSNLAEMCRQRGLLEEGESAGRRAVALDPSLVAAHSNLGIILQEAGKLDESATCLERVLAMQPDNAEVHNNLGNTLKMLGHLDKAAAHYKRALVLHPAYAEAHSNMAHLLKDVGDFEQAVAEARLAIELNPRLIDAYVNLAGAEMARQRYGEALRWLDSALAFAPGHAATLVARSKVLRQTGFLDEALDSARRAVTAMPHSAEAHNAQGEALQALGRLDEALACYDKAVELPGAAGETARMNCAALLLENGRGDEAVALLGKLLDNNSRCVSAWQNLAEIKTFTADDPDIARMESLLGPQGVEGRNERIALHFALGKAYLDANQAATAFHHLAQGNRMKRATFAYDGEAAARWMSAIAKVCTPALLKRLKGSGNVSEMPIFVVGMPRSGTSLVEQILASHPLVHGAGELRAMPALVETLGAYPAGLKDLSADDLARLGDAYLARVAPLSRGRRHVVDKMPANFLYAGLIHLILPNARIIHCRRDPVDTCLSCYSTLFSVEQLFAYDFAELGGFYRSYQALTGHWRKVLPKKRFLDLDYEAVVGDQEPQTRRLLDFLGLPWDDACLRFHQTVRPVRTASASPVRLPIYTTSSGRWRKYAAHLAPLLTALDVQTPQ